MVYQFCDLIYNWSNFTMIHFLEYYTYVTYDNHVGVLSIDKKWFEDWFNVFDLYKIAKICYQPTIRIPYINPNFKKSSIAKYYVSKISICENIVKLRLVFFYNENKWLDKNNENLSLVSTDGGDDFVLILDIPIAEVKSEAPENATVLDYICSTFTNCIRENIETDI